jgi:hypothetical protein
MQNQLSRLSGCKKKPPTQESVAIGRMKNKYLHHHAPDCLRVCDFVEKNTDKPCELIATRLAGSSHYFKLKHMRETARRYFQTHRELAYPVFTGEEITKLWTSLWISGKAHAPEKLASLRGLLETRTARRFVIDFLGLAFRARRFGSTLQHSISSVVRTCLDAARR